MGRGKREFTGDAVISSESPAALFCWGRLFWFPVDGAALWRQLLFLCRVLAACCCASMLRAQTRFSLCHFPGNPCLGGLSVPRPSVVFRLIRVRALADPLLKTGACALGAAPAGARRTAARAGVQPLPLTGRAHVPGGDQSSPRWSFLLESVLLLKLLFLCLLESWPPGHHGSAQVRHRRVSAAPVP